MLLTRLLVLDLRSLLLLLLLIVASVLLFFASGPLLPKSLRLGSVSGAVEGWMTARCGARACWSRAFSAAICPSSIQVSREGSRTTCRASSFVVPAIPMASGMGRCGGKAACPKAPVGDKSMSGRIESFCLLLEHHGVELRLWQGSELESGLGVLGWPGAPG